MSKFEKLDREINKRRANIPSHTYDSETIEHIEELCEEFPMFKKMQIKKRWKEQERIDRRSLSSTNKALNSYIKEFISFNTAIEKCSTPVAIGGKFILQDDGIFEQLVVGGNDVHLNKISSTPILPVSIYELQETGEQFIHLKYRSIGRVKDLTVPLTNVSIVAEIVKLSARGLDITSVNAKKVIEFISAARCEFSDDIKQKILVKKGGWGTIEGRKFYCLGSTVFPSDVGVERQVSFENNLLLKSIKIGGEKESWTHAVNWILQFPVARFYIGCGLAAPLLSIMKCPNFVVHLFGNSTVGKSTVLMAYLSFIGLPTDEGLKLNWYMTANGPEGRLVQFNDLGTPFDDLSQLNLEYLESFIYLITNGVGKQRSQVSGLALPVNHFNNVALSNGEAPIKKAYSKQGMLVRVVDIAQPIFGTDNISSFEIEEFTRIISSNYGFGEVYFEYLVEIVNNESSLKLLKSRHEELKAIIRDEVTNNYTNRMINYFSIAWLALEILSEAMPELNIDSEMNLLTLKMIIKEQEQRLQNENDIDERAFRYCLEHYLAKCNESKVTESSGIKIVSRRDRPSSKGLAFLPTELEKVLAKGGFSFQASERFFKEKGWLWIKDGRLWPVSFKGHAVRAYVLDLEIAEELGIIINDN